MSLIDSHIHLDFPAFDEDRDRVVERAVASGVKAFVVPSVSEQRWTAVQKTAATVANCFAGYGLHPCYLDQHGSGVLERLDTWLSENESVAVGECGLDLHVNAAEAIDRQLELFDGQIQLAARYGLPLIVHARKAVDLATQRLRMHAKCGGVVHSFSGSWQQACNILDLGFVLGIGGAVTHDRARKLQSIVQRLPDDAWVLETDSPDQPGAAHRGQRNEPAFLTDVAEKVSSLRNTSLEEVSAISLANTNTLFQLGQRETS